MELGAKAMLIDEYLEKIGYTKPLFGRALNHRAAETLKKTMEAAGKSKEQIHDALSRGVHLAKNRTVLVRTHRDHLTMGLKDMQTGKPDGLTLAQAGLEGLGRVGTAKANALGRKYYPNLKWPS
jgi:hypothetical protein